MFWRSLEILNTLVRLAILALLGTLAWHMLPLLKDV